MKHDCNLFISNNNNNNNLSTCSLWTVISNNLEHNQSGHIYEVDYDLQVHHDLTGAVNEELKCNIQHMLIYMESRGNPYSLIGEQRLYNFVSNAVFSRSSCTEAFEFSNY